MPILAAALLGLGKVGASYLQKPKEYKPDVSWIDKIKGEVRDDIRRRRTEHTMNISGQRGIAEQTQRGREMTEYGAIRSGVTGTGITEQANISLTQGAQRAAGEVGAKAVLTQEQMNQASKDRLRQLTEIKERALAEARDRHKIAESQWKRDMWGSVIEGGVGVGAAALQVAGAKKAERGAMQDAVAIAHAQGIGDTLEETASILQGTGAKGVEAMFEASGVTHKIQQGRTFFDSMADVMNLASHGITAQYDQNMSFEQNWQILKAQIGQIPDTEQALNMGIYIEYMDAITKDPKKVTPTDIAGMVTQGVFTKEEGRKLFEMRQSALQGHTYQHTSFDEQGNKVVRNIPTGDTTLKSITEPTPKQDRTAWDKKDIEEYRTAETNFVLSTKNLDQFLTMSGKDEDLREFLRKFEGREFEYEAEMKEELRQIINHADLPTNASIIMLADGTPIPLNMNLNDELRLVQARERLYRELLNRIDKMPSSWYLNIPEFGVETDLSNVLEGAR